MFGKIDLSPISGAAQLPDPLTRCSTDVLCHPFMFGLAFALYLAHTLSGCQKGGLQMRSIRFALLFLLVPSLVTASGAKEDWQSDLHKWVVSNDTNPNCKVRFTIGVYRPDMGNQPAWGMMTEKMFKWFSKDGVKLAPSVCSARLNKAEYRILLSVSPMKTVRQTTHGSEVQTVNQPFNANINSRTTYSDGSSANTTGTINGEQTSTVVVPTETTISQSSVAVYMYTYRVDGEQLQLIATDSIIFSRVAASGSGDNAAGAELGAGIGNLIRASGDRHRADKLYEEALKAISADAQDSAAKQNALPDNHAPKIASANMQRTSIAAVAPIPAPTASSATPIPLQALANNAPMPLAQSTSVSGDESATDAPETQFRIGKMYEFGKGVPKDYAQALVWYRKAADNGFVIAEFRLGVLYANGLGVPRDHAQSAAWFQKAAEQGNVDAQELLGLAYFTGDGVKADSAEAAFWLGIASASKVPEVVAGGRATERDMAAASLSPTDRARVQERVREWLNAHPVMPQ
jgi:tetratricopeptide (TPR) repeat protein